MATGYDCTFFDPANHITPGIEVVDQGDRRCWVNTRYYDVDDLPKLAEWVEPNPPLPTDPFELTSPAQAGVYRVDPQTGDALFSEMGRLFKGFVEWFAALEKRTRIVSVLSGKTIPLQVRRVETKTSDDHAPGSAYGAASQQPGEPSQAQAQPQAKAESETPPSAPPRSADAPTDDAASEVEDTIDPHLDEILFLRNRHPAEWLSARVIIQDPFIHDRNTAKNVGKIAGDRIEAEWVRVKKLIAERLKSGMELRLGEIAYPLEYTEAVKEEEQYMLKMASGKGSTSASTSGGIGNVSAAEGGADSRAMPPPGPGIRGGGAGSAVGPAGAPAPAKPKPKKKRNKSEAAKKMEQQWKNALRSQVADSEESEASGSRSSAVES